MLTLLLLLNPSMGILLLDKLALEVVGEEEEEKEEEEVVEEVE